MTRRAHGFIDVPVGWMVLPLLLAACSNTRGAMKHEASRSWTARPDIVELARLWRGDATSCGQSRSTVGWPPGRKRDCSLDGWQSVVLSWTDPSQASRLIRAHAENPLQCALARFAERSELAGHSNPNAVMGHKTAALVGGGLSGACISITFWYLRGGCDIVIFAPPSERESQPSGCASAE